ncbi:MAG: glycosyltransferase family A protein [Bacteroidota bacterium]
MPDLAFIVPCYNQVHWLPDALASVEAQTCEDWECIIVNDGSADDTAVVAGEWVAKDKRFRLLNQANSGLAAARNAGIRETNSPFLLPLDADDKIAPGYAAEALEIFKNDPELSLVYGRAEFFGDMVGEWDLPAFSWPQFLLQNSIYCSAVFRTSDWERAGGYREELLDGLEDWDLWLAILNKESRVHQIKKIMFYYRQRSGSMLQQLWQQGAYKMGDAAANIYCRHLSKYLETYGHPLNLIREKQQLLNEKAAWQRSWRYNFGAAITTWRKTRKS